MSSRTRERCLPRAALKAWIALYGLSPVQPGHTVLLQGTGGVAAFGLQIAQAAGAVTILTSPSDGRMRSSKGRRRWVRTIDLDSMVCFIPTKCEMDSINDSLIFLS